MLYGISPTTCFPGGLENVGGLRAAGGLAGLRTAPLPASVFLQALDSVPFVQDSNQRREPVLVHVAFACTRRVGVPRRSSTNGTHAAVQSSAGLSG